MAPITLAHISKHFGSQAQLAVDDLSLAVREGELLVLLGPSGCGKTTTLRMIAGFERPQAGSIALGAGGEGGGVARGAAPRARGDCRRRAATSGQHCLGRRCGSE